MNWILWAVTNRVRGVREQVAGVRSALEFCTFSGYASPRGRISAHHKVHNLNIFADIFVENDVFLCFIIGRLFR